MNPYPLLAEYDVEAGNYSIDEVVCLLAECNATRNKIGELREAVEKLNESRLGIGEDGGGSIVLRDRLDELLSIARQQTQSPKEKPCEHSETSGRL